MKNKVLTLIMAGMVISSLSIAQSVFPGKETLNKKDYFGLNLNSSIPQRYLEDYWQEYLKAYGKTHSRRGVISVDRANVPAISSEPVEMISQVSNARNMSHVFLAVKVGERFVADFTDSTYKATEDFLKEFASYSVLRDELRMAEEYYDEANKNHQSLERENERIAKEIERTEKRLEDLRKEQEINTADLAGSVIDLQKKQEEMEVAKGRVPKM